MSKKLLALVVVGIIVLGGGIFWFVNKQGKTVSVSSSSSQSTSKKAVQACDLFTLADAKQILGPSTVASKSASDGETSTSDVAVTMCTYNNSDTSTTATVLVRNGLTDTGVSSNKAGYDETTKQYKGSVVSGVGDAAYYNTDLGQLSVLKANNWLLITSGGLQAADHSQTQATQIAQAMIGKL